VSGAGPLWGKPLAVSGLPYGFLRTEATTPNVYPIGDQLAVIPSFSGDGTSLALASGIAAARAVLAGESASAFQRRWIANYRGQFRIVRAIDGVIANRFMRRIGIAVAQRAPGLVTALTSATRLRGVSNLVGGEQPLRLEPVQQT
jgi:flavin-dependent dehydrogenase